MLNAAMRLYLDTCARCGVCVEACHVCASMPQTRYTAVGSAEIIRQLCLRVYPLGKKPCASGSSSVFRSVGDQHLHCLVSPRRCASFASDKLLRT